MPYRFIDAYAPLTYVDTRLMSELQEFDRAVIVSNFYSYLYHAILFVPKIFSDSAPLSAIDVHATTGYASFLTFSWKVYRAIWHLGYLIFFLWPWSLWLYIKKPSPQHVIPVLLGAISISQMLVIVLFDYYDAGQYARLASLIQPQTYLFLVLMVREYLLQNRDFSSRRSPNTSKSLSG